MCADVEKNADSDYLEAAVGRAILQHEDDDELAVPGSGLGIARLCGVEHKVGQVDVEEVGGGHRCLGSIEQRDLGARLRNTTAFHDMACFTVLNLSRLESQKSYTIIIIIIIIIRNKIATINLTTIIIIIIIIIRNLA